MIDPKKPVENPLEFFGQRGPVKRIVSRIGAERPQSVAVIGGVKSGKTSLLNYLSNPAVMETNLDSPEDFLVCKISSDNFTTEGPESYLNAFEKCLPVGEKDKGNHYSSLKSLIEGIHHTGKKVVFLLDDFHRITGSEKFPLEFFSFLRSLANNYNLAYVTTSFLELQKLCVVKDIEESPFFNIFTNLSLGLLEIKDAVNLLASITSQSEKSLRLIVDWCGPSPYLLKLIGLKLVGEKAPGEITESFLEKALFPETVNYFKEIVSILNPIVFGVLKDIAKGKSLDPKDSHQLRSLLKQGFLIEEDGGVGAFSPAFSLFLKSCLTKKMLQGRD